MGRALVIIVAAAFTAWGACTGDTAKSSRRLRPQALVSANGAITATADELRTGWYPDQPRLDPATVGGPTFGRLWRTALPLAPGEQVLAQPLVVGGTVFVVTESNNLYSLDAESGAIRASRALGPAWQARDIGCDDLRPTVGITGTPVIDAASGTAYFLSKTYRSGAATGARDDAAWRAHAVDVFTLDERPGFPFFVEGRAANDPAVAFDAFVQMQRPGLLLMDGVVYAGFGGHCDLGFYNGWIAGFGTGGGGVRTLFATETGPDPPRGGGVWFPGGGLVSDGPGRIIFTTGNHITDRTSDTPEATPTRSLAQSLVRVAVQGDGSLAAVDFFAPYNRATLDLADVDFGAGGPVALPRPHFGTPAHPDLLVVGGKEGVLYLFDRQRLGGFRQGAGGGDATLSTARVPGGMWSRPAVWPGDGGWLYVVPNGFPLHVFRHGVGGDGATPILSEAGRTSDAFGYTSGSPIVTSNGTNPSSALVWVTFTTAAFGSGQLRAYDVLPSAAGVLGKRFEDSYGAHAKFSVPGVGNGRLYVGTGDGHVLGYGAPLTAPVTGAPVDFGTVVVGGSAAREVVVTASQEVTVTALALSPPEGFATGAPSRPLPARLAAGEALTVPVTFAPAAARLHAASLEVATSAGPGAVALRGVGQAAAAVLVSTPRVASFGGLARGSSDVRNVVLSNAGAAPLVWNGFTPPAAPFSVTNLPAVGDTLAPGASVTISVRFAPTTNGSFDGALEIASTGGPLTVFMSGSAGDPPVLSIVPASLDYGALAVGATRALSFTLSNPGGAPLTITKSKPPALGAFLARSALDEGSVLSPGQALTLTVAFAPGAPGSFQDQWQITGNDATGAQAVAFSGVGTPAAAGAGTGLLATYFDRPDLTGGSFTRVDATLDFRWLEGSPDPRLATDGFSVRWTGQVRAAHDEPYTFFTTSDDGVRLWVDGRLVIDNWTLHPDAEDSATVPMIAGQRVDLRMEFFEQTGLATAVLGWQSPSTPRQVVPQAALFPGEAPIGGGGGTTTTPDAGALPDAGAPPDAPSAPAGSGLRAEYFDRIDLSGAPALVRVDPMISFDWAEGAPDPRLPADGFSVRWTGQLLAPASETYTFFTTSDDGVRLWIDGQLVIDNWTDHPAVENSGSIALTAGRRHDLRLEFYENGGLATAALAWSSPSTPRQVVPAVSYNIPPIDPPLDRAR